MANSSTSYGLPACRRGEQHKSRVRILAEQAREARLSFLRSVFNRSFQSEEYIDKLLKDT